jgi:formylglycine-generating enzyme required for sulfatase activity
MVNRHRLPIAVISSLAFGRLLDLAHALSEIVLPVLPWRTPVKIARAVVLLSLTLTLLHAQARRGLPLGANGNRVALVIGNDAYRSQPKLDNAVNDARGMAQALRDLGFDVTELENATLEQMATGVNEFVGKLQRGDAALFYYSGHGMQIGGDNYLAPVDLTVANETQVKFHTMNASEVLSQMEAAGSDLQIVILDACRSNPFGRGRSLGGRGLAVMTAGRGTLLAYATAPGQIADDNGPGRNGLYTTYLLQSLREPGLPLEDVFKHVSGMVQQASGGKQIPWISSSVDGDFYFRPVAKVPDVARTPSPSPPDWEAWEAVRDSKDPKLLQQFIDEFPQSQYARAARVKIAVLGPSPAPPVSVSPTLPRTSEVRIDREVRTNPKDGRRYVWIPPGSFRMGCSPGDRECSDDESPAHNVTITKGFWIGQTLVTQEAYQKVTGDSSSHFKGAELPVEKVSWGQARDYCEKVGGRLPTEAEWEYAARAGSSSARYGDLDGVAWYAGNSGDKTHPVATKQPNAFTLYDMLGNVQQWVSDRYSAQYYGTSVSSDPPGPSSGGDRVLRGGSYDKSPRAVRVSKRGKDGPGDHDNDFGFRCVGDRMTFDP